MYITPGAQAQAQAMGEYLSSQALCAIISDNIPRPVAVGVLARDPSRHFVISEYIDLAEELPSTAELTGVMARLHSNSVSPTEKFGFDVATSQSLRLETPGVTRGKKSSREPFGPLWSPSSKVRVGTMSSGDRRRRYAVKLFPGSSDQWSRTDGR